MKKGNIGCLIPIIAIVCIVIWIRYDDVVEDRERHDIVQLQSKIDSLSDSRMIIRLLQQIIDMPRIHYDEKQLSYNRIVHEYENIGELDSALVWLDMVEKEYEATLFTRAHKATILIHKGDTVSSKKIYHTILKTDCAYNPMIWPNKIFKRWLNQKHSAEYARFNEYFYGNFCKIYAIRMLSSLDNDTAIYVSNAIDFINKTSEIGDIAKQYKAFREEHPLDEDWYDCRINNMSLNHLKMGDYTKLNSQAADIVSATLSCRIGLANDVMIYIDSVYTVNKASNILANNFMNMPAVSFIDLLLLKMMKKFYNIDTSLTTSLSYNQYKSLPKQGMRFVTLACPTTLTGSDSYLINHGVTKEFMVLKCNDWDISDSIPFNIEVLERNKGKEKTLIMLKDDYTTDTICFSSDKMGAILRFVMLPEPVYQMLLYDFSPND